MASNAPWRPSATKLGAYPYPRLRNALCVQLIANSGHSAPAPQPPHPARSAQAAASNASPIWMYGTARASNTSTMAAQLVPQAHVDEVRRAYYPDGAGEPGLGELLGQCVLCDWATRVAISCLRSPGSARSNTGPSGRPLPMWLGGGSGALLGDNGCLRPSLRARMPQARSGGSPGRPRLPAFARPPLAASVRA
jgi:hypothetical protein